MLWNKTFLHLFTKSFSGRENSDSLCDKFSLFPQFEMLQNSFSFVPMSFSFPQGHHFSGWQRTKSDKASRLSVQIGSYIVILGFNFTNILRTDFGTEVSREAFLYLHFMFVLFAKTAHKMMVKLTPRRGIFKHWDLTFACLIKNARIPWDQPCMRPNLMTHN